MKVEQKIKHSSICQKIYSGDVLQNQVPLTAEPGDNSRDMSFQSYHQQWVKTLLFLRAPD